MTVTASEVALREAADAFHKIVSAHAAIRLLEREGHKMPQRIFDQLGTNRLSADQIEKIAVDGFELCVRALAEMGAPDVSIHECGANALEEWG